MLDKTGSLPVSFPVQIIYRIVSYRRVALGTDWVDPLDPTVIAENELLSAANSIEAAAKKLAQLQPRLRPRVCVSMLLCVFCFVTFICVF